MSDVDPIDDEQQPEENPSGMPPELVAALMGGQDPAAAAGGAPAQPATSPATNGSGLLANLIASRQQQPTNPSIAMPPQPAAASPAPPPTDDSTLAMQPVPKPPDMSNSPLAALLTKYKTDQAAADAVPKPDPANYRPKLWQRLVGFAAGTAAGLKDPELGARTASGVVGRDWNRAKGDYDVRTGQLNDVLARDKEALGLAEAQSKIPQTNFDNQMAATRESREQSLASGRMQQYKSKADALDASGNKFIAGTDQPDATSPTGRIAQHLDLSWGPYTAPPSKATPFMPKNSDEALAAASSAKDPVEKQRLLGLAHQMLQNDVLRAKSSRPEKPDPADVNGYTPAEAKEIDDKGRMYRGRIAEWEKARTDLVGSKRQDDIDRLTKGDAEEEAYHQKLNDISDAVIARRATKPSGSGKQPTVKSAATATTAAAPAAAAAPKISPPPKAGQELTDRGIAKTYLQKAGGDPKKAQSLAEADGWKVPTRKSGGQ